MPFTPYTQINNAFAPAFEYYTELTFSTATPEVTLQFPTSFLPSQNYFAAYTLISGSSSAAGVINLPDPATGTPGQAGIFYNKSGFNISVKAFDGTSVIQIQPGQSFSIILNQESTWDTINVGSTTSQVDATALQGYGLLALNSKLNSNLNILSFNQPFTIDTTFRSQMVSWVGSSDTVTLPDATTFPSGFYFYIKNNTLTNGILTFNCFGTQSVDQQTNLILSLNQSCLLFTNGQNWFTEGLGTFLNSTGARLTGQGITVVDGSFSNPSYTFMSAPNVGFYFSEGTQTLNVTINGQLTMEFNSGGINYISPNSPFLGNAVQGVGAIFLNDMMSF